MTQQVMTPEELLAHMESKGFVPVRCARCKKRMGWGKPSPSSKSPLRNNVFCSQWCAERGANKEENTERNSIWRAAVMLGMKPLAIAREVGIDHATVYRTIGRKKTNSRDD